MNEMQNVNLFIKNVYGFEKYICKFGTINHELDQIQLLIY